MRLIFKLPHDFLFCFLGNVFCFCFCFNYYYQKADGTTLKNSYRVAQVTNNRLKVEKSEQFLLEN